MLDITTPNASSKRPLDALRTQSSSDKQTYLHPTDNHYATKHLLTKGLVTTKGWTLSGLLNKARNFHPVEMVHFRHPGLMQTIREHEESGIPLIIRGFHEHEDWPTNLFTLDWLNEHGKQGASARNVRNWLDFDLPLSDLIRRLRATEIYASENETERLYGKDAECPHEWATWLSTSGVLPSDLVPHGTHDYLNYLPNDVQTLMCYLGVGDTFTPFHKDLCASSGQNLMCYTENDGSSFWFMTKSSAAPSMAEYFHKMNEELDFETRVVTLKELQESQLDIYIAEQKLGDLVLVPPRSCHQVINHGGITMKTSWSRMTIKGLMNSLYHELPIYHRVCRSETYKVRLNIYRAVHRQTQTLRELLEQQTNPPHLDRSSPSIQSRLEMVAHELHQLLDLLDDILGEEHSPKCQVMPHVSLSDTSHQDNITCDFCGADVFQSFFECMSCASLSPMSTKSCKCGTMEPAQCRPFGDLLRTRDEALHAIRTVCTDTVKDYRSLLDHPSSITSARHVGIFTAACVLYERRLDLLGDTRICHTNQKVSKHAVLHSSYILCRACHGGRCMTHILEIFCTHAAPAFLILEGAEGNWHEYHREFKVEFKTAHSRIRLDEEAGTRPDFHMKLAYVASKFRICKSVNPNATLPGWYDVSLELHGASGIPSPLNQSGTDAHRGDGPMIAGTVASPSLTFGRFGSTSDLTSLPGSPSSADVISGSRVLKSLSTGQSLPGEPLANGKSRGMVMDCVLLPRLRKQEPILSDRPSSSTVSDHPVIHSISMSDVDDDDTSRPFKKQRVALPSDELLRERIPPLRVEKRVSDGMVCITNKPRPSRESFSDSPSPATGIQAAADVQIVLQEQLDLVLVENVRLKVANDELQQDRRDLEDEIYDLRERNQALTIVAQRCHAQWRMARDGCHVPQQGLLDPCSAPATLAVRHPEEKHSRDSLISHAEAPPTEQHALEELLD